MGISAYLQIYNDDDFLSESLKSIEGIVDELIVVDGCYKWMATYYSQLGLDPSRSSNKTYEILDNCKIPYVSINKIWSNQLEKRAAAYEACKGRYILRIDSDEIFHFYEGLLDEFLASDCHIAHMDMPEVLNNNFLITGLNNVYPKQCFLFDSKFVSHEDHLHYLWLVLHIDDFQSEYKDFRVFSKSIAFNIHLTGLRTKNTNINRASYYSMNWMRKNGFPILLYPNNTNRIEDFDKFFESTISPVDLKSIFSFSEIPMGRISINSDQEINLFPENLKKLNLLEIEHSFKKSLDDQILDIKHKTYVSGQQIFIPVNKENNSSDYKYTGEVDEIIVNIEAEIIGLSPIKPFNFSRKVPAYFNGKSFIINYSEPIRGTDLINCAIKLTIWTHKDGRLDSITLNG